MSGSWSEYLGDVEDLKALSVVNPSFVRMPRDFDIEYSGDVWLINHQPETEELESHQYLSSDRESECVFCVSCEKCGRPFSETTRSKDIINLCMSCSLSVMESGSRSL